MVHPEDPTPAESRDGSQIDADACNDGPIQGHPRDGPHDDPVDESTVVSVPRAAEPATERENTQTTQRCGGCGSWVAYRQHAGYDRRMREVAILQARCPTCGWQHTTLR